MLVQDARAARQIDGELGHVELVGVDDVEVLAGGQVGQQGAQRRAVVAADDERVAAQQATRQVVGVPKARAAQQHRMHLGAEAAQLLGVVGLRLRAHQ